MSSSWRIQLLGGLRLERGPEVITRFRSQNIAALLAYLALFPHRAHVREELADLLWPDADLETGRVNLRTALASLRRQLEPSGDLAGSVVMTPGRTQVSLNPDAYQTDVAAFESALAAGARPGLPPDVLEGHLARAVSHYNGPLLPGVYEAWALTKRDRLAEAYLGALRQLSGLHERRGDWDGAIEWARQAVAADPLREEAHGDVIRLLMTQGQVALARRQFETLATLLKEKLDSEPASEIAALLTLPAGPLSTVRPAATAALNGDAAPPSPSPVAPSVVRPAEAAPHNLPVNVTRFFGRDEEIAALQERLRSPDTRLITITGPGGAGKTRIATETARGLTDDFAGGIWYAPLGDLTEVERIPDAIASALGLARTAAGGANQPSVLARIEKFLGDATTNARGLLVLDNFEQLAEGGAEIVAGLLDSAPGLSCLVTSRQRLRIENEQEFTLSPLPTPDFPGTPERLLEFASVQLFVNRAQAARVDFALTPRNAAAVAQLCSKLEGIPLAIELAAAWMEMLTPAQMLQRMERRLDLLTSRRRNVSPRHRTLRAAIESSITLLAPPVRRFFAQLSVFRGGWTLEAAEAVTGEPLAFEYLVTLKDHSLLVSSGDGVTGELRFSALETLREFAHEMLQAEELDGAAVTRAEDSHSAFFGAMIEQTARELTGAGQTEWIRRLDSDHDNVRATLDRHDRRNDPVEALRLAGMLSGFWSTRGYVTEGRQRLHTLLERAGETAPALIRARALSGAGKLAWMQSDYEAAHACQAACLALYQSENDREGVAKTQCELANAEMVHSNYEAATALFQESLAGFRALGDKKGTALLLNNLGAVSLAQGKPDVAKSYLEESLPLSRAVGHSRNEAIALLNLATIWQSEGDWERARQYYEQSLDIRRDLGDLSGVGRILEGLARLAMEQGDADNALHRFEESLVVLRKLNDRENIASVYLYRGLTLMRLRNDAPNAERSLTKSLLQSREIGNKHFAAFALAGFATVALAQEQPDRAVRLWAASQTQRDAVGITLRPSDARDLSDEIAEARARLGAAVFQAAWETGCALTPDAAADFALDGVSNFPDDRLTAAPLLLPSLRPPRRF